MRCRLVRHDLRICSAADAHLTRHLGTPLAERFLVRAPRRLGEQPLERRIFRIRGKHIATTMDGDTAGGLSPIAGIDKGGDVVG